MTSRAGERACGPFVRCVSTHLALVVVSHGGVRVISRRVALLVLATTLLACGVGERGGPDAKVDATAASTPADASAVEASEQPPAGALETDARVARLDGFGALKLGMSVAESAAAWPDLFAGTPRALERQRCFHVPVEDVSHFALMFDGGRFVRYGGSPDNVAAPGGGRRGMPEADLRGLYRDAFEETPDRFAPGGKRLALDASGVAPSRLVFLLRPDGVVNEWHVGLHPQIDYPSACEDAG